MPHWILQDSYGAYALAACIVVTTDCYAVFPAVRWIIIRPLSKSLIAQRNIAMAYSYAVINVHYEPKQFTTEYLLTLHNRIHNWLVKSLIL